MEWNSAKGNAVGTEGSLKQRAGTKNKGRGINRVGSGVKIDEQRTTVNSVATTEQVTEFNNVQETANV